jgi:hypothetical protein
MHRTIRKTIYIFSTLIFACSLMAMTCNKNCQNLEVIPAKINSINAQLIDKEQTSFGQTTLKANNVLLTVSPLLSSKDSTVLFADEFCNILKLQDTLLACNIYTVNELNADYPAGSDVTNLFRIRQFDYAIDKPFYISVPTWLQIDNGGVQTNFLFAEKISMVLPRKFQLNVRYTYANKVINATTSEITITQ